MNDTPPCAVVGACPGLPDLPHVPIGHDGEPVFAEPWQAQAFALVLALHERGCFSWPEWAQALAQQISLAQAAGDVDDGSTYYRHWLAALEAIVAGKGLSSAHELARYASAWDHAADRTPHGQPITLHADDFPPG